MYTIHLLGPDGNEVRFDNYRPAVAPTLNYRFRWNVGLASGESVTISSARIIGEMGEDFRMTFGIPRRVIAGDALEVFMNGLGGVSVPVPTEIMEVNSAPPAGHPTPYVPPWDGFRNPPLPPPEPAPILLTQEVLERDFGELARKIEV